jgi:hypothetical protein
VTVHSLRGHSVYVAPVRIVLGSVCLLAARVAGAGGTGAVLAFASGAFFFVFLAFNDPRSRVLPGLQRMPTPLPLPDGVAVASPVRQALAALVPSTAGLTVLAAIAVVPKPVLTALLGGIIVGLGLAGLMRAYFVDPSLLFDRRTGTVYRR